MNETIGERKRKGTKTSAKDFLTDFWYDHLQYIFGFSKDFLTDFWHDHLQYIFGFLLLIFLIFPTGYLGIRTMLFLMCKIDNYQCVRVENKENQK